MAKMYYSRSLDVLTKQINKKVIDYFKNGKYITFKAILLGDILFTIMGGQSVIISVRQKLQERRDDGLQDQKRPTYENH